MYRWLMVLVCLSAVGCRTCPPPLRLDTPEQTLETFRQAFACDHPDTEYRCFAEPVKRAFKGLAGYSVGREIFRRDNRLLTLATRFADLEGRLRVDKLSATRALAHIDTGDAPLEVGLTNELEYVMTFKDGAVVKGYASASEGAFAEDGSLRVRISDPHMERRRSPPELVEIRSRWVIDSLPGLEGAVESSRGGPTP